MYEKYSDNNEDYVYCPTGIKDGKKNNKVLH